MINYECSIKEPKEIFKILILILPKILKSACQKQSQNIKLTQGLSRMPSHVLTGKVAVQ